MKRLIIIVILTGFWAGIAHGEKILLTPPSSRTINQTMTKIGKVMAEVLPLILAKRELSEDEQKRMGAAITRISKLFEKVEPHIRKKSDAYQISYDFVSDYLKVTKFVYDTGELDYARGHLYALGEICTSCHTQDTKWRTLFRGTTRDKFSSDFAYGEFNYFTRNYNEAIIYYDKYLSSSDAKTELEIVQPIQRLITIYTQILNLPGEGAGVLKKYLSLTDHTPETKKQLAQWISGLERLEASGVGNITKVSFKTLESYVAQYLGSIDQLSAETNATPQVEVLRVWLRGLLYHYLNGNPTQDEIPKILYWLSLSERSIAYNFYFSLADLYLKQCVMKYSSHPYAKLCLHEYEAFVEYTYTGPNGSFVPPEIQKELSMMKKAIAR